MSCANALNLDQSKFSLFREDCTTDQSIKADVCFPVKNPGQCQLSYSNTFKATLKNTNIPLFGNLYQL